MGHDSDLALSCCDAFVREGGGVFLLGCSSLNGNRRPARIAGVEVLRVAGSDAPCGSNVEVGHHVDLLFPIGCDGERRNADIKLGPEGGDDRWELGVLSLPATEAHDLRERLIDIDVVADRRLPVGVHELCRGITGRGSIAQGAPLFDIVWDQCCDLVDCGDRGNIV